MNEQQTNETETTLEQRLTELQGKYDEAQAALAESRRQLGDVERRGQIDQALIEADAIDLEAARLLTEVAVGVMEDADVAAAVDELKLRKPYLFRRAAGSTGVMSAKMRDAVAPVEQAAHEAGETGHRRDLLRYLRLRRGAA